MRFSFNYLIEILKERWHANGFCVIFVLNYSVCECPCFVHKCKFTITRFIYISRLNLFEELITIEDGSSQIVDDETK
ncbi:unnamed protein product [Larinioides sclopetarius]|uniref:Uncharacterized protein n=1 Tax=Larinioides sclopetarius TaxID=280406 RepID=A0AAV2AJ76_9ARAC